VCVCVSVCTEQPSTLSRRNARFFWRSSSGSDLSGSSGVSTMSHPHTRTHTQALTSITAHEPCKAAIWIKQVQIVSALLSGCGKLWNLLRDHFFGCKFRKKLPRLLPFFPITNRSPYDQCKPQGTYQNDTQWVRSRKNFLITLEEQKIHTIVWVKISEKSSNECGLWSRCNEKFETAKCAESTKCRISELYNRTIKEL